MTRRSSHQWAVAILVPLALSACGDRDREAPTGFTPVTVTNAAPGGAEGALATTVGGDFKRFADADNTMAPRDPTSADVPALDVTAAPIDN